MYTIQSEGHNVQFFGSIEELPIKRFNTFKKYLLIDAGLGNDMGKFNDFYTKILQFLKKDRKEDITTELKNWQLSHWHRLNEMDFRFLALSVLVHTIDGQERSDTTDEGITTTLQALEGIDLTTGKALSTLALIKKNFSTLWN